MKKIISLMLAFVMCFSGTIGTFAANEKELNTADIMQLAEEYGVNCDVITEYQRNNTISVSREELISLFRYISTADEKVYDMGEVVIEDENPVRAGGIQTASKSFKEWVPGMYPSWILGALGAINAYRYVDVTYDYRYVNGVRHFVDYREVTSNLTGIALMLGWDQVVGYANFTTTNRYNDTMRVIVKGYTYFGIQCQGINLSIQFPRETWTYKWRLA